MKKQQRFIPFFILLAAVFGCSRFTDKATNSEAPAANSAAVTPAETVDASPSSFGPFTPSGDPKADIEKMADRFLSQDSFRAQLKGTGTIPVNSDLEYLAPDRFHLTHYGDKGKTGEIIVVGKTTYMNPGDKGWQKIEVPMSVPSMRENFSREGMKWFKEIKYVGEETLDGKSAHVYSFSGEMPGVKKEYDSKIWINAANGLPLKIKTVYRSGDLKTMDIVYNYEMPVKIAAPMD